MGGAKLAEWACLDVDGATGRILVGWNCKIFIHKQAKKEVFSISGAVVPACTSEIKALINVWAM